MQIISNFVWKCDDFDYFIVFSAGSIVVDYRVTWNEDEKLSDDILSNSLTKYLKDNHGYIYNYFVPTESLSYSKTQDMCVMRDLE